MSNDLESRSKSEDGFHFEKDGDGGYKVVATRNGKTYERGIVVFSQSYIEKVRKIREKIMENARYYGHIY